MRMFRSIRTLALATLMLAAPLASFAGVFLSVSFGPPVLPFYEQPLCPGDGYIWTPGYWAYGDDGYFWVPGTWVIAPRVGYLWTPGYWGWGGDAFLFHEGYWGPHVGFYGGINYGYGYGGHGYEGGYWDHDHFDYNRSVNNVNVTNIHNVYNKTVINNVNVNRVSYNGGKGGINVRPQQQELAAQRESHVQPTSMQLQHQQAASTNRAQFATVNHGQPAIAATPRPGAFNARGVVPARSVTNNNIQNNNRGANGSNHPNAGYSGANGSRPLITAHPNGEAQSGSRPAYQPGAANGGRNGNYNGTPQNANRPAYQGSAPNYGSDNHPNNGRNGNYNGAPNGNTQNRPNNGPQGQSPQRPQAQPNGGQSNPHPQAQPQYAPRENQAPRQSAPPREYNAPRSAPEPHNTPAPHAESAPRVQSDGHGAEHEPHNRR